MKVLHFTDSLRSGGRERQLVELVKGASFEGRIIPEIVCMSCDVHYKEIFDFGIKIHFLTKNRRWDPGVFCKFYNICNYFKPDVIHTWDSMTSVYAIPVAKILRIPLINGMVRDAPENLNIFNRHFRRARLTLPFSDLVVGNTYAGLIAYDIPAYKARCLYNGFDFKRLRNVLSREEILEAHGIKAGLVVGMVASFTKNKDYKTFVNVAIQMLGSRSDVSFVMVGDGPEMPVCQELVPEQFKQNIKFLGRMQDVESIVNSFDVGVLATNTMLHGEGISNSIMEYMALGKPVVATRGGGTGELVLDKKTGFLVDGNNPGEMKRAIISLLDDHELRLRMGECGKERIISVFNLEKMNRCYYEMLNDCIANHVIGL